MDAILAGSLIASTLRVATPLILCAMAGMLAERSGVVDLGLEGKMLFAAFAAGSAGVASGSLLVALLAACAIGVALSWLHGFACVNHAGDQVVSGMAINIIAAGLTVVLAVAWFEQGGQTPPAPDAIRMKSLWPEAAQTLGPIVGEGFFSQSVLVYVGLLTVPAVWWLLYRTRFGLRLRAVGENPNMVDTAGLSVRRLRYMALTLNGVLC